LSTTSSISVSNLSGFASLHEIAAIKGREEFFTPRRQGAKEIFESKHRISFLNLSVLASLRETSVTQGREEFLSQRRKGAREIYASKHRISFLNLSVLASLRETSVTQNGPASARGYGSARAGLHNKPAEEER
jgi:hypothetical protein